MKLFVIRLENADTLIVTAEDHQDAVRQAGLTSHNLSSVVQQLQNFGVHRDQADLVLDGIGPQKYEIRELNHIFLQLRISEQGSFDLQDMDEHTFNALMQGYPIMSATDDEIADRWPEIGDLEAHKTERDALLADAFSREKTRLMLPAEPK
jgi:hypothetical protein